MRSSSAWHVDLSARPLAGAFTTLMGDMVDIMPHLSPAHFRSGAVVITIMARTTMTDI